MPPGLQHIRIRIALLRLVEKVSLGNDADQPAGPIDNGQATHPVALEEHNRFLERRLGRCGDNAPSHYLADGDHESNRFNCECSWLGPLGPRQEGRKPVAIAATALLTAYM